MSSLNIFPSTSFAPLFERRNSASSPLRLQHFLYMLAPPLCPQQMKRHVYADLPLGKKRVCTCKKAKYLRVQTGCTFCTNEFIHNFQFALLIFLLYYSHLHFFNNPIRIVLHWRVDPAGVNGTGFIHLVSSRFQMDMVSRFETDAV